MKEKEKQQGKERYLGKNRRAGRAAGGGAQWVLTKKREGKWEGKRGGTCVCVYWTWGLAAMCRVASVPADDGPGDLATGRAICSAAVWNGTLATVTCTARKTHISRPRRGISSGPAPPAPHRGLWLVNHVSGAAVKRYCCDEGGQPRRRNSPHCCPQLAVALAHVESPLCAFAFRSWLILSMPYFFFSFQFSFVFSFFNWLSELPSLFLPPRQYAGKTAC